MIYYIDGETGELISERKFKTQYQLIKKEHKNENKNGKWHTESYWIGRELPKQGKLFEC